jgi:hypothetical protein
VSAKTSSWTRAEEKADEIRRPCDPELAELAPLGAEKQLGRIFVEDAVALYIDDMRIRSQARLTAANARSLFQSGRNPMSLVSWVTKQNSGKQADQKLLWLDQLDVKVLSAWRSGWKGAPPTLLNRWCRVVRFAIGSFAQGASANTLAPG